jgi:hypothetical protein
MILLRKEIYLCMSWMQYMFKIHYIHPYIADNVQNSQFLVRRRSYFFEGGIMMKKCLILEIVVINDGE